MEPEAIVAELEASGLRGRGGAGFPAGRKASFLPKGDMDKYLVCNADESEPGTFKDRELMQKSPHMLIEGIVIAARGAGITRAFIYIRGEYEAQARDPRRRDRARRRAAGYIGERILGSDFSLDVVLHRGAGAYICGEETGLLDSLEGKRGNPRLKPPFPAIQGLYQGPTLINNVETLSTMPHDHPHGRRGVRQARRRRTRRARSSSRSRATCSGPATTRSSSARPSREIIFELAGGPPEGRTVKLWFPGGSSSPVLTAADLDVPYDFDSLAKAGTMLGSGAIIVVDDSTPVLDVALKLAKFYRHESCGKCTPCREGTNWTVRMLERIDAGEATPMDLDIMASVQEHIIGNCLCVLGDAMAMPIGSMIAKFRDEFEAHMESRAARCGRRALMPRPEHQHRSPSQIDGREVQAPENMMLADAAKLGDVEIPVFCYEPKLGQPVGACRMCLVEIEGIPKLQTACSTAVKDGMIVHTQSERARAAQQAVVEFLLVNHPLDCPVCDKGGECPLQDITFGWGGGHSRFIEPKRHFRKPLELSPLIAIDRERCILCYRCVRYSQEVSEDYQLILLERGAHSFVGTFDGHPYVAPFSGNIIELCPVGALTSRPYRFRARPWEIEGAGTLCTLCPAQCNVTLTVRDERVLRVLARQHDDVDDGWLCDKGRFAYQAVHVDERITAPMIRDGGELRDGQLGARARARPPAGCAAPARGRAALAGGGASNEEGLLLGAPAARGARLAAPRLARRRAPSALDEWRALAAPALAATRLRPRVRPRRARARLRADRRRADPRAAHPQGRAAQRRQARRRDRPPERARPQRRRDAALRPGPRRRARRRRSPPRCAARTRRARRRRRRRRRCARGARADAARRRRRGRDPLRRAPARRRRRAGCSRSPTRSGSPGTPGAGLIGIPDAANGRGLREAGVLPNAGPGLARRAARRRSRRTRDRRRADAPAS